MFILTEEESRKEKRSKKKDQRRKIKGERLNEKD